jgi:hypothetical protein
LIVTSDRGYEISGVLGVEIEVASHLHRDLGGQEGVRCNSSVVCRFEGVGVGNPHAVVCFKILT